MSLKEGAVTQTMASSAGRSRRDLASVVQHTAFLLLALHSCARWNFFLNSLMHYSSVIFPPLGWRVFSIKRDIADDNPRQVLRNYAIIFVWLSAANAELIQFS